MPQKRGYIYGPVASRRLGSSLGIDLVPRKICDYDCIYCQLGATTRCTTRRKAYVPAGDILLQLERRLPEIARPDYITISGSGEPTLNSELGEIIAGIRRLSDTPIAVITNSSLLGDDDVAVACSGADLVVPSLDAADEETFRAVNRPCRGLGLREVAEGLRSFGRYFEGELWLEVMIIEGINSGEDHVSRLAEAIEGIALEKVQINTVVRPPAEPSAHPVEREKLEKLASLLGDRAEIIGPVRHWETAEGGGPDREEILDFLGRRPCTIRDVSAAMDINYIEASKVLSEMVEEGLATFESHGGEVYYQS
ncbi:MAG: radical SAM protein [Actinomycetota bacterium]|nr:radical SAM protein [Actinomycetota bacterium]